MKKGLSPHKWATAPGMQFCTHLKFLVAYQMEMSITKMFRKCCVIIPPTQKDRY